MITNSIRNHFEDLVKDFSLTIDILVCVNTVGQIAAGGSAGKWPLPSRGPSALPAPHRRPAGLRRGHRPVALLRDRSGGDRPRSAAAPPPAGGPGGPGAGGQRCGAAAATPASMQECADPLCPGAGIPRGSVYRPGAHPAAPRVIRPAGESR